MNADLLEVDAGVPTPEKPYVDPLSRVAEVAELRERAERAEAALAAEIAAGNLRMTDAGEKYAQAEELAERARVDAGEHYARFVQADARAEAWKRRAEQAEAAITAALEEHEATRVLRARIEELKARIARLIAAGQTFVEKWEEAKRG